jgi:hypothetical protein
LADDAKFVAAAAVTALNLLVWWWWWWYIAPAACTTKSVQPFETSDALGRSNAAAASLRSSSCILENAIRSYNNKLRDPSREHYNLASSWKFKVLVQENFAIHSDLLLRINPMHDRS